MRISNEEGFKESLQMPVPTHGEVANYVESVIRRVTLAVQENKDLDVINKKEEISSLAGAVMEGMDEDEDNEGRDSLPSDLVSPETALLYWKFQEFIGRKFPFLNTEINRAKRQRMN